MEYHPKKPSKKGLTLRLKLEHFPTLHKHIYLLDLLKKKKKNCINKTEIN